MADVILDAKMSNDELLNSIDKTLGSAENKFDSFVKDINEKLNTIGGGMAANLSTMFNDQLTAMENRVKQLQTNIDNTAKGVSDNGGTVSVKVEELQRAAEYAKDLAESMGKAKKNAKDLNAQFADLSFAKQQTKEEKVNLEVLKRQRLLQQEREIRAKLASDTKKAADEESKARITIGSQSYTNAMAMQANSIQQRIEKIKALQNVQKNLLTTDTKYQSKLASTNREIRNLQKANKEAAASGIQLEKRTNSLTESFKNLGKRVLFYTGLGAMTGFVKQLYDIRGEYEMIERSMGALIGDFARGSVLFNQIQEQALKSPFTVIDLSSAAKQLLAYNFAIDDVAETTKRLADISSALGVPMERIVYNLGQIKAQGVLNARDARDFANAGLAIVPMLAKLYTEQQRFGSQMVTTSQVYDMMSKKMVSYSDVLQVIDKVTSEGGMFFDFQAKQAETLKGQISNLVDAWNYMLSQMGKDNNGVLKGTISVTRELLQNWRAIQNILLGLVGTFGAFKVAKLALNAVVGQGTMQLKGEILLNKQKAASDLMRKQITVGLTAEEKTRLATMRQITAQDYASLIATKGLTKEQLMLKYAIAGKNSVVRQGIALSGLLTKAELAQASAMSRVGIVAKSLAIGIRNLGAAFMSALPTLAITGGIMALGIFIAKAQEARQRINEITDKYADLRKKLANIDVSIESSGGDLDKKREELDELVNMAKEKFNIVFDIDVSRLDAGQVSKKVVEIKNAINNAITTGENFELSAENVGLTSYIDKVNKSATNLYRTLEDNRLGIIEVIKAHKENRTATEEELKALKILVGLQGSSYSAETLKRMQEAYSMLGLLQNGAVVVNYASGKIEKNYDKIVLRSREFGLTSSQTMETASKQWDELNSKLSLARGIYDKLAKDIKRKVDFGILSAEEKEKKVKIGIDAVASKTSADEFTKYWITEWANKEFGTNIKFEVNKKSLTDTQIQLALWQQKLQDWADRNNIKLGLQLNAGTTEQQVAQQALQNYKDAVETKEILNRIPTKGMTQEELIDLSGRQAKAAKDVADKLAIARRVGADLSSITNKVNRETNNALSELAQSIKIEIGLIDNLTKNYDKLTKSGMSSGDAIAFLGKEYQTTVDAINKTLTKYNLQKFNVSDFAGRNVSQIVAFLEQQRQLLPKNAKADVYKQFDVQIEKMKVEAKTYDLSQITKSLERDLANVKESYELGIEIDADPIMGNIFQNAFNIPEDDIIRNLSDAIDRIQIIVNKKLLELSQSTGQNIVFDITKDNPEEIAKRFGLSADSDIIKALIKAKEMVMGMYKKNIQNAVRDFKDFTDSIENEKADVEKEYKDFIAMLKKTDVGDADEEYQKALILADKRRREKLAKIDWKYYQKSSDYAKAFGNVDETSTATIARVIEKLEKFKQLVISIGDIDLTKTISDKINSLTDSFLNRQYTFVGLSKAIKDYNIALKEVKKEPSNTDALDNYAKASYRLSKAVETTRQGLSKFGGELSKTIGLVYGSDVGQQVQEIFDLVDALGAAADGLKDIGKASKKANKAVDDTIDAIDKSADAAISGIGSAVKTTSDAIETTSATAAKSISTLEKASVILAVVSAALQIIQSIRNADESIKQENQDMMNNIIQSQIEYNKALIETKMLHNEVFGSNPFGNIMQDITASQYAMQMYNEAAYKQVKLWQDPKHGGLKGLWQFVGNAFGSFDVLNLGWGKWVKSAGNDMGDLVTIYKNGMTDAISNLRYITQKGSKGFLGIGSKGTKTKDLRQWVKQNFGTDLFDDKGLVNLTIVDELLSKHADRLTDETKNTLTALKEYAEKIKEVEDSITSWATDVFGDLSTNLSDSLVESFRNGENAADQFKVHVGKVLETLGQQMLQNLLYENVFKAHQGRLESLTQSYAKGEMTREKYLAEVTSLTKEIMDDSVAYIDTGNLFLQNLKDEAKKRGMDIYMPDDSTKTLSNLQQGIQSVTETTANALEAKINSIDAQGYLRNTLLQNLIDNGNKGLGLQSEMLLQMRESHQIQLSIQSILNGWSDNNGRSVRVTMIN